MLEGRQQRRGGLRIAAKVGLQTGFVNGSGNAFQQGDTSGLQLRPLIRETECSYNFRSVTATNVLSATATHDHTRDLGEVG